MTQKELEYEVLKTKEDLCKFGEHMLILQKQVLALSKAIKIMAERMNNGQV